MAFLFFHNLNIFAGNQPVGLPLPFDTSLSDGVSS